MKRSLFLFFGLGFTFSVAAVETTEHQRVGMEAEAPQRCELGLGVGLTPWSPSDWDLSFSPRLSLEFARAWGVSVSVPYRWVNQPDKRAVFGHWDQASAGLSWTGTGEPRWKTGVTWSGTPWWQPKPEPWTLAGEVGFSLVRDPVIWAATTYLASIPDWSGGLGLSFQEVVNDAWVWSLSVSPHWSFPQRVPPSERISHWGVSIVWSWGWYEAPWSLSTAITSGSGTPWGFNASGSRTW